MKAFLQERNILLKTLGSNAIAGLSDESAAGNAQRYGENRLTKDNPESLLKRIWDAATEPMILMLIAAGIIALAVNIIMAVSGDEADFLECIGIFVAISLSVIITVVMEGRSAKAFEALNRINENVAVKAIRNKTVVLLNQKDIVVGDILLLSTGDKVPVDGRLLESTELAADESSLTGESLPVSKDAEAVLLDEKTPVAERHNMLYAGTYITGGFCRLLVTAVGDKTEFGKIARELSVVKNTSTPLQEKLNRLGKTITIFGITAAVIVFASQLVSFAIHDGLVFGEIMEAFITSIVLIVAAVPEGLPTIVAVSLSINVIKLSNQNALVKKMIASETVGCINIICSDKTGTLTENRMTVVGYHDRTWHGDPAELDSECLSHNICLNTTADIGEDGAFIGNPTECALLYFYEQSRACQTTGQTYKEVRGDHDIIHTFPFSSELKHMTTICRVDGKIISYVKGSPECIFAMCSLSPDVQKGIETQMEKCQRKAMRIIAFAHKELHKLLDYSEEAHHHQMESDMVFEGFVAIADPLRSDVYDSVQDCRRAGVQIKILTGDNIVTAAAIAKELRLLNETYTAVEARELEELSDEELSARLDTISVIARSTPTIKMRVVNLLKDKGNVVAVTGDGINDAPALKNADVGIAMGISGTEVSKEASDIVLLNDSFSTIVRAVQWGRGIYENFKRFISFQLTVNVSSVIVVLTSILMGKHAPFTALQLLWINIIMDGPPALTLGLEPVTGDLMVQQPVRRSDNILSKNMLGKIGITGLYISGVFMLQYIYNFLGAAEFQIPTVLFTLFAVFQLFNAFNCRELHRASIFKNILNNKLMLLVVGATFALQIFIIQFAGAFFGTIPLPLSMWLKIFGTAFSVIIVSEMAKLMLFNREKS